MKGLTPYQLEILQRVMAAPAEEQLDLDQLLEQLSWQPTKESLQFPIRSLVTKKMLQKNGLILRRGRQRVTYTITSVGRLVLDPRGTTGSVSLPAYTPPVPVLPAVEDDFENLGVIKGLAPDDDPIS